MFRAASIGLLLALGIVLCPGCGSSDLALENDLKQLGLAYHNYHDANRQGPPGWDEFLEFAGKTGEPVDSLQRVRSAGYQVQWGVKFSELTGGLSNTVLANRPGGGPTLMMDGSVRR